MNVQRINRLGRLSSRTLMGLALIALFAVLSGYTHPLLPDEGAAAHIFQLSVVAFVLVISLFLFTADWRQPWRSIRSLAFPIATLALSFGGLYYLEHYR
jgi:hypothetical protein